MAGAETLHERLTQTQPIKPCETNIVQFRLPSAQALDGLVEYFESLRVNELPIDAKINFDPLEPCTVRVSLPLPIESIVQSIDLKTLGGIIISEID